MTSDYTESRQEKLARLLTQNKTKIAHKQLSAWYQERIGYHVAIEQFIDLQASYQLKWDVYRTVGAFQQQHATRYADFQDVLKAVHYMKQRLDTCAETTVIWYYRDKNYHDGGEIGGIKIKLKDIWTLLWKY